MAWSATGLGAIGLAALPWLLGAAGVRVVLTPSVPRGLYATTELRTVPQRGEYVCVKARAPSAPEALRAHHDGFGLFLKRVGGTPGDRIEMTSEGVTVNGRILPFSKPLDAESDGKALPHPTLPRTLGDQQVWLTSEHARGFDSRYFGAVPVSALSCRGAPLWTW